MMYTVNMCRWYMISTLEILAHYDRSMEMANKVKVISTTQTMTFSC